MASNRKFLLLCAFVVGAVAVPVSKKEQCARHCTNDGNFQLQTGSTYTYDYETTTTTAVQGSSQDKSQIQLTSQVDIEVLSPCDLSLRLRGVTLKLSDPESPEFLNAIRGTRDFARSLEKHILRFSFQNGQVEHVCPTENVPIWVTNIQKGVLSAFQTQVLQPDWSTKATEIDVLGKCTAEYQSLGTSWQGTHTIRKIKDLSLCTERENVDTYLQGTPYTQEFQTKSLPLVKGKQECEQVIGRQFLQSSTCREKLVFRPFSNGGSSVVTNVVQKLSFATVSDRTFTGNDYRPTTEPLLFRHANAEENPSRSEAEAEAILRELCDATQQDVSITVPRIFSTFVYKLRKLPLATLRNFYQKTETLCPNNPKARKFFMDAIPIVATTDSAKFMYDLISRGQISESETNFWLTSLSFVNEPTADIIATFTPLLNGRHDQALLGISALMHTFCKSNDCSKVPEIKNAVSKLFTNLGENCFNADDKKTIMTLKAISNVGAVFSKEKTLEACYKNPQLRMETRLAAIQAFRRVSCDVSREDLMQTYSNYNEDVEIRIAAYLGVMTCPSTVVVDTVKEVLMKEKINHVGSFIWTHLNALSKSKHPHRQDIRDIVSNLYLLNKYNSDARKFSTAREATFFLEWIDSGFHIDNHLVFSTDSYLPRTAMFNLTVDVFGKTCNLFQIDGRMEGLEHIAESFFGPGGYFPQKNIAKMLREKRSLSNNKIQDFDEKFQAKSRFQQTPYGSLDLKIFGTTLYYDQFKQDGEGTTDINLLDVVTKLAEEHEAEYSRSFMFLDTTFTVPMTSGMPLRIAVNGTASVGLKYGGKFDVKSFEHVDVVGHVEPSGAIEIASLLTVDAGNVARSGLRVVGTMHSSTMLDGRLEVRNGEVIKAQLNMPRDRIDIFNIQSKMYLVHGQEEREQKIDRKGETDFKTCTGSTTSKIFGVQLCSELHLPPYKPNSALHPTNGPASFDVYIQKTDPQLKSYTFDAEYKLEMKNGALLRHGLISMNTPDSQVDRDVKMEVYLNHAENTATLKVKTPIKRFGGNAKLVNEEALKKLLLELTIDEKEYFSMQTELRRISDRSSVTYMPSLEIRIPSRRLAAITGSAYMKYGQKYTAQLQIEDLTEKPILAKGNLESSKKNRFDGELSINSFVFDGTVKGYAQLGDSMASRVTAEYKFLEGKMNKINIMGKMRNLSANSLSKYNGLLNIQASLLPEWNTELAFETMTTTGHIENTISLALGDGVRSRVHTIRLQEILRYEGNLRNNKVDGSLSLVYPEKNIDYAIQVNHENTESSLKNTLTVQYDSRQKVTSELKLGVNQETPFSVEGDMKVKYPGREAALSASLVETSPNEYTTTMSCQWQEGRKASFMVNYKDRTDTTRIKYELEGALNLPHRTPITFTTSIGSQRGQYVGIAELNMGMEKYRTKLDYVMGNGVNHRASGQLIMNNEMYGLEAALQYAKSKLSCNVEIKMPHRHKITAKFDGRTGEYLQSGNFETLWDADRDTSKRFGISGEIRNNADGYDGKVTMQIRRRTLVGSLSTSMKGEFLSSQWNTNNKVELEWSPSEKVVISFSTNSLFDRSRQQLNSQIEITTPFENYENLSLSLTHMYTNQQWETELSTTLPQKNTILLSTSGRFSFIRNGATIETKTRMKTSFSQMRETYFELAHDHSPRELTSKLQFRWGSGKRVGLDLSGEIMPSVYRSSLKFTSSFKNFEDISAEIVHNHVPDNYKSRCELQWAPRRKVAVNFEGKHLLNGRRRICTISLSGSSPFDDFENTAAMITYSNDGNSINNDIELNWSKHKKITASFSASKKNSPYQQSMESKFQVTSPFRNYENFQISSSLETNRNNYKFNIDAHLPHRSTASLNSQGKITSLNDIEFNTAIIGHLPKYMQPQRVSFDFVHKLQNSKLRSSLDTAYNDNRLTILLIGLTEAGYNSREIEFSATVNTPFRGYEEIKSDFSHSQRSYEYSTTVQGSINKLFGSLTHKLKIPDMLNFETTLEATSSESENAKISVIQMHNQGQLEHTSTMTWGRNKKINLNAQYISKSSNKEITLKISTPFRNMRDFESKLNYDYKNWDHTASISFVLDRKHKATLSGSIRNYRWKNVNTDIELTSSFAGYEFHSTNFKYDLTAPQKSFEMSYLWNANNRKAITLKANLLHSYSLTNMEIEITTPYRNFNQISFTTKLENNPPETNLNIFYERDSQKTVFNGKLFVQNDRAQVIFDLSTPYQNVRNLKFIARYDTLNEGMSGEITTELNRGNKYQIKGEYKLSNRATESKIFLLTPIEGYRNVEILSKVAYGSSRKLGELLVKWENDNNIRVNCEYNSKRNGVGLTVNVQSSFEKYEEINFSTWYKVERGLYEGEIKTVINKNQIYEGNVDAKYGGNKILDLKLNIKLPGTYLKNFQLTTLINSESNFHQITSTVLYNDQQSNFNAFLKLDKDQLLEFQVKLESPYKSFKQFNVELILRQRNYENADARLKIITPFEALQTLNAFTEVKTDNSGYTLVFTLNTDGRELKIKGNVSNRQFSPFTGQFEVDAPFASFKKITGSAEINMFHWNNARMNLKVSSPSFNHELLTLFIQDDDNLDFQIKIDSTAIPNRNAMISVKAIYDDLKNIQSEASLQVLGKIHFINMLFTNNKNIDIQVKLQSPLLPENKAELSGTISRRRRSNNRMTDVKFNIVLPSSTHEVSAKYDEKGSQITTSMKIDSAVLKNSPLEAQAKYTNGNNRDFEASLTVTALGEKHVAVGSLKNYENEKFVQMKIECPMVNSLNPFSITGTLKHENFENMDGSLSVGTRGKEIRIAGNMKNEGWKNIEAFVTLNTPFRTLPMLRVDGRFKNDKFQNIDCSFQVETANSNIHSFGMTSKIIRSKGSEEISLMLHLPLKNYRTIQVLANAHYSADFRDADSRITLTMPPSRYSISGQYGINSPRLSGTVELELNGQKWSTSGKLDRNPSEISTALSFTNPRSQRYNVGATYGNSERRHFAAAWYYNPSDEKYGVNSSMRFIDFKNFESTILVETPFERYRNVEVSVNQQFNNNYLSTNVEYTKNSRRGFLKVLTRTSRNSVAGSVHIGCPYAKLRDIKLSYNHLKRSREQECFLELHLRGEKQFKAELLKFGDKSSHVTLDIPVLPMTVTADRKQLPYGTEVNFKSDYQSRIIGFRTTYQNDERQILHDAMLAWDEKADKKISYDFKLGDTDTGKELWARFDSPIRSLMLKGNFTNSNRARSGGIDFYWDASRNLEKHMAIGAEHTDLSSGRQTTHRVLMKMEHPRLSRDIIQTYTVSYGPSEFLLKSEASYSRQRHHNLLIEVKATDLSRNKRNSHFKGEFILRHPITRLDIRANGEIMNSKLESSANIKINSVDNRQVQHIRELKVALSKIMQQIDITMKNDETIKNVLGKVSNKNGEITVFIEVKKNEENLLSTLLKVNEKNMSADLSVVDAENTGVHASASFPGDTASLKLSHSNKGNVITDVNLFVGLVQSKILKSQLNWRPKMWEELRITTGENLRAFMRSAKETYSLASKEICQEFRERNELMSRFAYEQITPFAEEVSNDLEEMKNDLRKIQISFDRMYRRNEFLMQDIVRTYRDTMENMKDVIEGLSLGFEVLCNIVIEYTEEFYYNMYYNFLDMQEYLEKRCEELLQNMGENLLKYQEDINRFARHSMKIFNRKLRMLNRNMDKLFDQAFERIDNTVRAYAPFLIDAYFYTKYTADSVRYHVNHMYDTVYSYIGSNKYCVALRNYAASIAETIQAFRDYEYTESAQAFINRIYDAEMLQNLMDHPNVEYVSNLANTALRKSVQIYYNTGMDTVVASVFESATNYAKEMVLNAAQDLLSDMYQLGGRTKYEFAPHRGYMAFEISLPAARNNLLEVFDITSYPEYQKAMTIKKTVTSELLEDFCIWDYYYKVMKYFTPGYWLPTFTGHAMIAGNQHYITFDKLSYDFAGKCSYLLARDFVDGNFSVVINYGDDHQRKSLTVLSDGKKIDIGHDYKITVDDTKTESPLQIGQTVVMREGANIRIENDKKGFYIVCNFVHNYCSVSLSGFYYAKTGGLFGTFNYEPKLDLMMPTRHMANDLETFAGSWEVGQVSCRSNENLATVPSNSYKVHERCKNLFSKPTSEFRACFKQVDPEPFLQMCINDLSAVHERKFEETICESAAAYFVQCKVEGVPLKMPSKCVRCEKQDGTMMTEGEALKFTRGDVITAADVVFLIEEKQCNKDRVRYLGKLAQSIEDNYKEHGYKEVRFSVVAFGGDEIHSAPHVHTMDGQISGPLRSLESALGSLKFGAGPINILEALRYAASLNFRPGTTKSFVLVKCSTCKSEEVKAEYGEMLRTLIDGDISLHLLMEQKYEMKVANKNSKARKVFGVDKTLAYTLKDVKDTRLSGDGDLLAQLRIPKDVCIPLAFEVNGSTFDVQFLTDTKKNTNKKFIDVMARRVVKSSSRSSSEWGMCCECIATTDGVGKSTCQKCVSAEIANMISAETSGINMISDPEVETHHIRVRKHKGRRGERTL